MKLNPTLLAFAVAGLASLESSAAQFTYSSGDLLLSFRKTGSSDFLVNIGSITIPKDTSNFRNYDSLFGGSLLANFGGNLNGVTFSVIGTTKGAGVPNNGNATANTSWLTRARSDTSTQTAVPARYIPSKTQGVQSQISGIAGDGAVTGAKVYAASSGNNTAPFIAIPAGDNSSYTSKSPGLLGLVDVPNEPLLENTAPGAFNSGFIRSDLYEYVPGTPGQTLPATYLGNFTVTSAGSVSFTPVPEPREYAAIFGGLLLAGAVFYRRTYGVAKA